VKRIVVIALVALLGWKAYERYDQGREMADASDRLRHVEFAGPAPQAAERLSGYQCDGRIYCSQMSSCEEAKFFLQHCPGTKMDGDNDGTPCEQQWCVR
jgi:hypothetical protein